MEEKKKGVLKNFTWKKFLIISFYLFLLTLLVGIIISYLDLQKSVVSLFTFKEIIGRIIAAIITGFILSLLIIRVDYRKKP